MLNIAESSYTALQATAVSIYATTCPRSGPDTARCTPCSRINHRCYLHSFRSAPLRIFVHAGVWCVFSLWLIREQLFAFLD